MSPKLVEIKKPKDLDEWATTIFNGSFSQPQLHTWLKEIVVQEISKREWCKGILMHDAANEEQLNKHYEIEARQTIIAPTTEPEATEEEDEKQKAQDAKPDTPKRKAKEKKPELQLDFGALNI